MLCSEPSKPQRGAEGRPPCRLGGPWGPSWGDVGVIWGRLGVPLEPRGLPWGAFGSSCRCRGSVWAALGGHAAETACTKCGLLQLIPRIPRIRPWNPRNPRNLRNPRNPWKWCQEVLFRPLLPRAPVGQDDGSLRCEHQFMEWYVCLWV